MPRSASGHAGALREGVRGDPQPPHGDDDGACAQDQQEPEAPGHTAWVLGSTWATGESGFVTVPSSWYSVNWLVHQSSSAAGPVRARRTPYWMSASGFAEPARSISAGVAEGLRVGDDDERVEGEQPPGALGVDARHGLRLPMALVHRGWGSAGPCGHAESGTVHTRTSSRVVTRGVDSPNSTGVSTESPPTVR